MNYMFKINLLNLTNFINMTLIKKIVILKFLINFKNIYLIFNVGLNKTRENLM